MKTNQYHDSMMSHYIGMQKFPFNPIHLTIIFLDKKLIALATLLAAIVAAGVQGVNCFWMCITARYNIISQWDPDSWTVFVLNIFATIALNLNIVLAGMYIYHGF